MKTTATAEPTGPLEDVGKRQFTDPQAELRREWIKACKAEKIARELATMRREQWERIQHDARLRAITAGKRPPQWLPPPPPPVIDMSRFADLRCGAKGKRTGKPCPLTSIYANGRCKFHGGMSTGPKSAEGKARAALNGNRKAGNAQAMAGDTDAPPVGQSARGARSGAMTGQSGEEG